MPDIDQQNHFLSIWTRPRDTIQAIIASNPEQHVLVLAALGGVSQALDRASMRSLGDTMSMPTILGMALIGGPFMGLISLYIGGALIRLTGSWLGGRSDSRQVRTAIAWGSVPIVASLLLWPVAIALFGIDIFSTETPRIDGNLAGFISLSVVEITLAIWALVLTLKAIGEVHGFSAWRALGSVVLMVFLIVIPILFLAFLLIALAR